MDESDLVILIKWTQLLICFWFHKLEQGTYVVINHLAPVQSPIRVLWTRRKGILSKNYWQTSEPSLQKFHHCCSPRQSWQRCGGDRQKRALYEHPSLVENPARPALYQREAWVCQLRTQSRVQRGLGSGNLAEAASWPWLSPRCSALMIKIWQLL